jgi:predicted RecB family nuclease
LDLLRRKGMEHERAWLERLRAEGKSIVEIQECGDWTAAATATEAAMCAGVDVIYQAVSQDGSWRGIADFLVRVPQLTALGPWGYEAWDTKLARRCKPSYVLQLAFTANRSSACSAYLQN